MPTIDKKGFLTVTIGKATRNWWLGRSKISIKQIVLPKKYWGKRIQLKIRVIKDEE
tara:strand:+ start:638 stop:805 length:168 start_codon:yes stop_codon:yes gene_type:complete